jgi:CHAD domain-containing protein
VAPGLLRIYRTGAKRYRRAERGKGKRTRTLHRWRKAVKDLRYAGEALDARGRRPDPGTHADRAVPAAGQPGVKPPGGSGGRGLRRLAKRADRLGEMLGEEHDLAVLAELLSGSRAPLGVRLPRRSRRLLLRAVARRRRELRVRALRLGDELYDRSPKRMMRGVRAELRSRQLS